MNTKIKYRQDIDGLRALAILGVVFFHAFPRLVPGGFIGVDVFFVLSGYLISSIVIKECAQQSFRLAAFYQRRIRRIFPALIIVLVPCLIEGWFVLLPDEYTELGKNTSGAAGFISNYLYWQAVGYFDASSDTKPLLHLWSLGIEEQFYIIWPLLVMIFWRSRFVFLILVCGLFILSFTLNIKSPDPLSTFYLPTTRFWELLIGCLLAVCLFTEKSWIELTPRVRDSLAALGLSLIMVGLFCFKKGDPFPGWRALLPTLGTFSLILAGEQAFANRVLFSNRLMVFFGVISFPLYLYHWPLLSFARILWGELLPHYLSLTALALAVVFAFLTARFVEKPFRFGGYARLKTLILSLGVILVGVSGFFVYQEKGFPLRKSVEVVSALNANTFNWIPATDSGCLERVGLTKEAGRPGQLVFCHLDSTIQHPGIAIIGDSMSDHLYPGFKKLFEKSGVGVIQIGMATCNPFNGIKGTYVLNKECEGVNRKIYNYLLRNKDIKTVILAFAPWGIKNMVLPDMEYNSSISDRFKIMGGLVAKDIEALKAAGKNIVATFDLPNIIVDPHHCMRSLPFRTSSCNIAVATTNTVMEPYLSYWKKIVAAHKEICFFEATAGILQGDHYRILKDNRVLYRDDHHLSLYGSDYVASSFMKSNCYKTVV